MIGIFLILFKAFFILLCLVLIGVVLLQRDSKGAGLGAMFGSAGSHTVFGSQGESAIAKFTWYSLAVFFVGSILLTQMNIWMPNGAIPTNEKAPKAEIPAVAPPVQSKKSGKSKADNAAPLKSMFEDTKLQEQAKEILKKTKKNSSKLPALLPEKSIEKNIKSVKKKISVPKVKQSTSATAARAVNQSSKKAKTPSTKP